MKPLTALLAALFLVALAACVGDPAPPAGASEPSFTADAGPEAATPDADVASAVITGVGGSGVSGTVTFRPVDGLLRARVRIEGLTEGEHGFHVHEGTSCAPDSAGTPGGAAGGHLNPLVSLHGAPSSVVVSHHAGDLGNITAGPDGVAAGVVVDSLLSFSGPTSVEGHAVVVHAGRDDLETQPDGASGRPVGCGVVRKGPLPTPWATPPAAVPPDA
ncbi:superoxide dismutase family protein [Rubrivirga sp. S365]|uniref:Superoxide dismutase family protein n=1 Tax=Rubrivirga litoralis TaxID=3075598 RepID=A0ABU3BPL5_9BACT|nr:MULTISPECIES: superoxide dismutase family protein [unclassified Rubrivirga]MDT0631234.1 superoxide dismutase family protein [Rubrivirga sp. F394]MDT7856623.1 superoxide dismutase family protein [Rubrivirga sp. S365]